MKVLHNPKQNQILAALHPHEFKRLSTHLELVPMPLGMSYYESNGKLQHVYFPTTSTVSMRYVMESGGTAEIAGVGNEGMVGVSVFMGSKALPKQAIVRTVGFGYRLKARLLLEEFNRAETLQHMLIRYTKALITQASQTVICNRYHSVEEKICRWLLLNYNHILLNDSVVTPDLLASSIGVRRDVLAEALRKMREAGTIGYYGGNITVLNQQHLESQTCECYGTIKMELDSLHDQAVAKPKSENVISLSKASSTSTPWVLYNAS
jgi:hypothetical protein